MSLIMVPLSTHNTRIANLPALPLLLLELGRRIVVLLNLRKCQFADVGVAQVLPALIVKIE
jgi:hypothetical protein